MMNMPQGTTEEELKKLIESVGLKNKKVFLASLKFIKSLDGKLAYALVEVGSQKEAVFLKDSLKNHWIADKLLKVKSYEDRIHEDFDNRTIMV